MIYKLQATNNIGINAPNFEILCARQRKMLKIMIFGNFIENFYASPRLTIIGKSNLLKLYANFPHVFLHDYLLISYILFIYLSSMILFQKKVNKKGRYEKKHFFSVSFGG